jgi:hypothetical protein
MLFTPAWLRILPGVKSILNTGQIKKLEILRKRYNISHDLYSQGVIASSELGKIVIRRDYKNLKQKYPDRSEKEILTSMLQYENQTMKISGSTEVMTEEQITDAMSNIDSVDDLCDFVVGLERREQPAYYENEICTQIESIIKNKLSG